MFAESQSMGFPETNFSPAALTSLSLSVITGDRQDPSQGCTMCHSDEVPTLREYSKSWGQIKKRNGFENQE